MRRKGEKGVSFAEGRRTDIARLTSNKLRNEQRESDSNRGKKGGLVLAAGTEKTSVQDPEQVEQVDASRDANLLGRKQKDREHEHACQKHLRE